MLRLGIRASRVSTGSADHRTHSSGLCISKLSEVLFDLVDVSRTARFWRVAIGGETESPQESQESQVQYITHGRASSPPYNTEPGRLDDLDDATHPLRHRFGRV